MGEAVQQAGIDRRIELCRLRAVVTGEQGAAGTSNVGTGPDVKFRDGPEGTVACCQHVGHAGAGRDDRALREVEAHQGGDAEFGRQVNTVLSLAASSVDDFPSEFSVLVGSDDSGLRPAAVVPGSGAHVAYLFPIVWSDVSNVN